MRSVALIGVLIIACSNSAAYTEQEAFSLRSISLYQQYRAETTEDQVIPVTTLAAATNWGQTFSLNVGEKMSLAEGLTVAFESVIADGRCPKDVDCIWEGNAEIEISVVKNDHARALLKLNTSRSLETEHSYLEYTVKLIALEPYPKTSSALDLSYVATLAVLKNF